MKKQKSMCCSNRELTIQPTGKSPSVAPTPQSFVHVVELVTEDRKDES